MIAWLGKLLRPARAGEHRGPLTAFTAPATITVNSEAFADGGAMPLSSAGKGVGDDISPPLRWSGVPPRARQLVLVMDDIDVPLHRPILHTVAVIDPAIDSIPAGLLRPGAEGIRCIRADLDNVGYAGPRPIPGHGPHRYRFHLFALDEAIPGDVTTAKGLLTAMRGHVLARGTLTGTYERY